MKRAAGLKMKPSEVDRRLSLQAALRKWAKWTAGELVSARFQPCYVGRPSSVAVHSRIYKSRRDFGRFVHFWCYF